MDDNYIVISQSSFDIGFRGRDGEIYNIRQNKGYWISKDGQKLYPNEFDYNHLVNTIKKIDREAYACYVLPESFKIYNLLKLELKLRIENSQNLD